MSSNEHRIDSLILKDVQASFAWLKCLRFYHLPSDGQETACEAGEVCIRLPDCKHWLPFFILCFSPSTPTAALFTNSPSSKNRFTDDTTHMCQFLGYFVWHNRPGVGHMANWLTNIHHLLATVLTKASWLDHTAFYFVCPRSSMCIRVLTLKTPHHRLPLPVLVPFQSTHT